eukprot:TRINITY_DN90790_c0_g1_i1.p1 TRINITY_DN90790_c0_g1~~TRINITY_DN90790_c0_g1_i1.p1  ORF type:complete len:184 (+),score=22.62 TRINITY_DN90790_c0_g1_i1:55-606(+)
MSSNDARADWERLQARILRLPADQQEQLWTSIAEDAADLASQSQMTTSYTRAHLGKCVRCGALGDSSRPCTFKNCPDLVAYNSTRHGHKYRWAMNVPRIQLAAHAFSGTRRCQNCSQWEDALDNPKECVYHTAARATGCDSGSADSKEGGGFKMTCCGQAPSQGCQRGAHNFEEVLSYKPRSP